jgi:hypothetical protein
VALIGYPVALVLSIVLFALPARPRVSVLGVVPAVVVAGLVVGGGGWYADGQVDATTATTAVPAVTGAPGRALGRLPQGVFGLGPVPLANGLVVTGDQDAGEVTVIDAAGTPRWHYTRHDAAPVSVTASRDEHTVVAVFQTPVRSTVLGFDAATGVPRWQWWAPLDATQVIALPDVVVAVRPHGHGTATAVDPSTGRQLWSLPNLWSPTEDGRCQVAQPNPGNGPGDGNTAVTATGLSEDTAVASDADLTAVLVVCGDRPRLVVHAVDRSGRVRWTATYRRTPANTFQSNPAGELLAVSRGAVLVWNVHPNRIVALDPATGHVNWTTADDAQNWLAADDDTVVLAAAKNGRLRQLDATTGKPTTTQPPATLTATAPEQPSITATAIPGGATVHANLALRDGRLYVLATDPATLTVLDLRTDRVVGTYPLPTNDSAAVIPAPSYAVLPGIRATTALGLPD